MLCGFNGHTAPAKCQTRIWRWFTEQRHLFWFRCQDERKRNTTFKIEFVYQTHVTLNNSQSNLCGKIFYTRLLIFSCNFFEFWCIISLKRLIRFYFYAKHWSNLEMLRKHWQFPILLAVLVCVYSVCPLFCAAFGQILCSGLSEKIQMEYAETSSSCCHKTDAASESETPSELSLIHISEPTRPY